MGRALIHVHLLEGFGSFFIFEYGKLVKISNIFSICSRIKYSFSGL